ncbi:hypothetical protein AAA799E16_01434 [Marine Group I thaumarchaeote SCGC AAA799-E16]|uniref:Uncharacterized protein n=1 Tax=Marine Group I thaumarchaeote SCGC AAA799-E16 TaxID=1502292 RepID=A0A081S4L5_9ARCH|nr:hypothetical protein AAA799E16_01434 [Marine Group I thaumarchaeote SCGC AAA799-E16]
MLLRVDPELEKLKKHLNGFGVKSSLCDQHLDFESDYIDAIFLGTNDGIGNAGSLKVENSPIDFIQVIRKQEYAKCDYVMGGRIGMGVHKHSWWKLRFFLSFPQSIQLGPLDIGTITTIKKGLLHSQVEDFVWNGYQKLTTLPPGLIRDNVADALYQDQRLRILMTKCLLKERTILVSRYSPKQTTDIKTNSKVVIESQWKFLKDIFIDSDTLEMYEIIATIIKNKINELKYHLTY